MKTIFHNGNIITMDPARKSAQAVCVEGKKIRGVGTDAEMLALKEPDTRLVDLEGKTLLPGFYETHMHILSYGMLLKDINHNSCDSIAALIQHSKKHIAAHRIPDGTWVRGRGWNQDNFSDENRFISRYDLDAVSTTHPLAFMRTCGHVIVVNSRALEIMGMTECAPEIPGGQIDLDAAGKPLGIFREQARRCVLDCIPEKTKDEIKELICLATDDAVTHGIVEIHSDDFKDVPSNYQKVIDAFSELVAEDRLKIRVYEQCNLPSVGQIEHFLAAGYHTGYQIGRYTLGPLKLLSDGALGARTAYLNAPYSDDPSTRGIMLFTSEQLEEMIGLCHKSGMQVAIHAIGDGALDILLDCIEKAKKAFPRENERHGIIHCQVTSPAQVDRMWEMDLIAYIQPIFLNYDLEIVEDRLGLARAATAYNWKEFIEKGIHTAGGSDCPVESLDVMENIYAAVQRKNLKGQPAAGWRTDQCLTVEEALRMFTTEGAYASFGEDRRGSITPGKSADFVIIDEDICTIDPEAIKDIRVRQTWVEGDLAHAR